MNEESKALAEHMSDFGLCLLGRAIYDSTFSELGKPYGHTMSVYLCAQATEILLKAAIAEQHHLLIFTKPPKLDHKAGEMLSIERLFDDGQTVAYNDLPNLLLAVTNYRLTDIEQYKRLGTLRNKIVHFAVPSGIDFGAEVLRFAFEVLAPLVKHFWNKGLFHYAGLYDEEIDEYLVERLTGLEIVFEIDPPI